MPILVHHRRRDGYRLASGGICGATPPADAPAIPTRGSYAFEVKWDGFRCLLSTENGLRAGSRRGWDMTDLLPGLASFPIFGMFDGELVAFPPVGSSGDNGPFLITEEGPASCLITGSL